MAIILVKKKEFRIKVKTVNGTLSTPATFVKQKGNDGFIFSSKKGDTETLIVAHRNDIQGITVETWDNVKKVEGVKKISIEQLIEHLNSFE